MTPSSKSSDAGVTLLCLSIRGRGPIPSFKNHKRIHGRRLVVEKKIGRRMDLITLAIEFALFSAFQTVGSETGTGCSLASWTALSAPLDDSLAWIPSASFEVEYVSKGNEGADIYIEKL